MEQKQGSVQRRPAELKGRRGLFLHIDRLPLRPQCPMAGQVEATLLVSARLIDARLKCHSSKEQRHLTLTSIQPS